MGVMQPSETTQVPKASPTELAIRGMTCSNCARHVTEAIQSVPAVASASVQLDAGRATVRWKGESNAPAVVEAVKGEGYGAELIEDGGRRIAGEKEQEAFENQNSKIK